MPSGQKPVDYVRREQHPFDFDDPVINLYNMCIVSSFDTPPTHFHKWRLGMLMCALLIAHMLHVVEERAHTETNSHCTCLLSHFLWIKMR